MSELTTTQTTDSVAGNQPSSTATTADSSPFDWASIDFGSAPEDILAKVPLDKHPGARKMQSSLRKQTADLEKKYKSELALAQEQIRSMTELINGQMPEAASQVTALQTQARMRQLEGIVHETEAEKQRRLAIEKLAETYDVDPALLEDVEDGYEAFDRIIKANGLRYSQVEQKMVDMERRLAALTRVATDPAASPDTTSGRTAGSTYQDQYDALMKAYRGDEASKLRRKAEAENVTIDPIRWRG